MFLITGPLNYAVEVLDLDDLVLLGETARRRGGVEVVRLPDAASIAAAEEHVLWKLLPPSRGTMF